MIEVVQQRPLEQPVFVVALSGWVDAGSAGQSAVSFLEDALRDSSVVARVDLDGIVDFQQVRPEVALVDGVTRKLTWPEITFTAGKSGVDTVVCRGPEPSLRWQTFAGEFVEFAQGIGVRTIVTLGGMPVAVSHRRPMRVLSTATNRSLAQEVEPVRPDYTGPTGVQTAIQVASGAANVPALGLWAQVPYYLGGTVSPVATRALLSRLQELTGVEVDLRPLDAESATYERQVEETVTARSELAELVDRLDTEVEGLPTGEELASEIEEFLRGDP